MSELEQAATQVDTEPVQEPTVNPVLQQSRYRGLTPWKPGQSGNPSGKAKNPTTLTGILADLVDMQEIGETLIAIAKDKSQPALRLEAIKYIYSRIEGNPVQAMRFQAEGVIPSLIFLHPGREAPAVIEAESTRVADTDNEPTPTSSQE